MSVPTFLIICFTGFAIFYPAVMGKNWSNDQVKGYRIGMLGAAVSTGAVLTMNYFFPIEWLY
jgi:hypothetical protein